MVVFYGWWASGPAVEVTKELPAQDGDVPGTVQGVESAGVQLGVNCALGFQPLLFLRG